MDFSSFHHWFVLTLNTFQKHLRTHFPVCFSNLSIASDSFWHLIKFYYIFTHLLCFVYDVQLYSRVIGLLTTK